MNVQLLQDVYLIVPGWILKNIFNQDNKPKFNKNITHLIIYMCIYLTLLASQHYNNKIYSAKNEQLSEGV